MSMDSGRNTAELPIGDSGDVAPDNLASPVLSVLLADDTSAYQALVRSLLIRRGHKVAIANHGREAVDLYLRGGFDVVLMDIQMPVMDGFEATRAIRNHESAVDRRIPIIAITTHTREVSQEKCLAAGMDAWLPKPLDAAQLFQLVESLGQRYHAATPNAPPQRNVNTNDGEQIRSNVVADIAGSVKRLGGDTELFRELVHIFDEDSPAMLQSLKEAVEHRDGMNIERFAHSLRGLTSNFGAKRVFEAATRLEEFGRNRTWHGVDHAAHQLVDELTRLNAVLDDFRIAVR